MYLGFERYLNLITERFMSLCTSALGAGHSTKNVKTNKDVGEHFCLNLYQMKLPIQSEILNYVIIS